MQTKKHKTKIFTKIILIVFFTVMTIVFIYPIVEMFAASFTNGMDYIKNGISFKNELTWANYERVFVSVNIVRGLKMSAARTAIGTLTGIVCNTTLAYILSRKRFIYKKEMTAFFVIAAVVDCGLMPRLLLYKKLMLTGSFWVYIIPRAVNVLYMLIIKASMDSLSKETEEAALLEGASHFTLITKIIIPQCKGSIALIMLFIATDQWNDWFDAMLYNRLRVEYTVFTYEIMKLLSTVSSMTAVAGNVSSTATKVIPLTVRCAAQVVAMAPIPIMLFVVQKYMEPVTKEVMKTVIKKKE